jgi:hypothetical protein
VTLAGARVTPGRGISRVYSAVMSTVEKVRLTQWSHGAG